MTGRYLAAESALPIPPWTTVHLANRDLAGLIPINFVTHAGVSLTSACFAHGIFDDSQAEKCISNLLAAQFKRFIIDLYWDSSLRQFTFCPVSINSGTRSLGSSSILPRARGQTSPRTSSGVSLGRRATQTSWIFETPKARPPLTSSRRSKHGIRQAASFTLGNASDTTSHTSETSSTTATSISGPTSPSGDTVYEIGPYQCSSRVNLPFLTSLITDYIVNTSTRRSANLLFLQFNLHAAASEDAPTDPAPQPSESDLPVQTELVGSIFKAVTSSLPYQPSELLSQRANLNNSWYTVATSEQPVSEYFDVEGVPGGQSTPDGWPTEYFVELKRFNRVLLGWGSIDPQMEGYNFAGDSDTMFPQNYLSSPTDLRINTAGQPVSDCFYNAEQTTVATINSSWAISFLNEISSSLSSSDRIFSLAENLTACGITPTLNVTLANQTADLNASPYVQFVQSTVWNWARDEPRNASVSNANSRDDENTQGQFRCALMENSTARNGSRWRVEYCNIRHRAACRIANEPYLWRLSDDSVPFFAAELACPANSFFSVPRTGLENMYLHQHILSLPEASGSDLSGQGSGVWLNFNSLDTEACWVANGQNGSCPYYVDEEAIRERIVLVPVIAALVVLLLTALTLFVKCNKNRRNSRKRIRGEGGWDYEGVPS